MGWAGKTLLSGSESDDTEAETVFHIILINLPSLSLWLGGDVAGCSLQTLPTHPPPANVTVGRAPRMKGSKFSINKLSGGGDGGGGCRHPWQLWVTFVFKGLFRKT